MIPIIVWIDGRLYLRVGGASLRLPVDFERMSPERQARIVAALESLRASAIEHAESAKALSLTGDRHE